MGTRKFMDTVAVIYRDVLSYVNYKKLGKTPSESDTIQDDQTLALAKELVGFIKSGSYLPERRYKSGCQKLLKVYTEGKQPSHFVDVLEVDVRTVKKYGTYIIKGLDVFFDGSLLDLWVSRSFEQIKECLDSSFTHAVRDNFIELVSSFEVFLDMKTDLMRLPEIDSLLSSWTDTEYADALVSVRDVLKLFYDYNSLKLRGDLDIFNAVKRSVKQGLPLPKGIVSDINDLLNHYFDKGIIVSSADDLEGIEYE